jgi:ArsR family transcriptional regulator
MAAALPVITPRERRPGGLCEPAVEPDTTPEAAAALAAVAKALADPTRLRMLDLLAQQDRPLCVCDITAQFPQNQPTISHHLKLLRPTPVNA